MTLMTIEMLPALHGDALWVEWGDKPYRVVIDGGPGKSYPALKRRVSALGDDSVIDKSRQLVEEALENGAHDNTTVVVVSIDSD